MWGASWIRFPGLGGHGHSGNQCTPNPFPTLGGNRRTTMKTTGVGSKALIGTIAVTALVALTAPTFARGGGVGGISSSHISSQGSLNTNGPNAADRDFGR